MNDVVPIRRRDVVRVLKALDPSKATGSDKIPAKILKVCAVELSIPIMRFVTQMIAEGSWPAVWRRHLVAPIHKKKAKSDPNNYRGVHMTSVLSKVCERIIAKHLARSFQHINAFGDTRWAFRTGRTRQDMIAVLFSKWMLAMNSGKKIGLYLSDISGAFDRVNAKLLMKKLARIGLSPSWLAFIKSYLAPRKQSLLSRARGAFRTVHHRRHGVPRERLFRRHFYIHSEHWL